MNMNMDKKQMEALLSMAGKKLGVSPDQLKSQLENGSFDKAMSSMPPQQAQMLRQALSDPKTAEKILSTPQAQAIYKKISK